MIQQGEVSSSTPMLLTVSLRCSGSKSFNCAMHSFILSLLFFSINRCGSLYVSYGIEDILVNIAFPALEISWCI